jgi:uncharacterized protein YbcI
MTELDHGTAAELGELRAAIASTMVGLMKQFYGKGPTKAKTYIADEYLFEVMDGGLTRNEETLLAAGEEALVRQVRLRFQETIRETVCSTIGDLVGVPVVTYHSQIVFDPPRTFEVFVLEEPLG